MADRYHKGLHRYAVVTAAATLFLLLAGALVTSNDAGLAVPDWPLSYGSLMPPMVGGIFYEHGHRMVATFVGLLTIGLAVWLWRREERRWLRRLGWAALAAVILQGLLGGLTVIFLLPTAVSVSHASLAQLFFCTIVAIALFTSRWWQSEVTPVDDPGSPSMHRLAVAMAAVVFIQLVLGAAFRHQGIGILPHILWAVVVLGMTVYIGRVIRKRFPGVAALRRPSVILSALVGAQILLGLLAWWTRLQAAEFPQPPPFMVAATVVHLVVGALTLATSVVLALCVYRVVRPSPARAAVMVGEQAGATR